MPGLGTAASVHRGPANDNAAPLAYVLRRRAPILILALAAAALLAWLVG
jgi:hypothetical protein